MKKKHGLLGASAIYTAANMVNASIPFFLMPVLTRVLSPADYGVVAMFGVSITVLGIFTGLSVHGLVGIRYFEKDKIDFPRFVASCMMILLLSTLAILGVVIALHTYLEEITKLPPVWLAIAVLVSGAQFIVQIRLSIWLSERKPWKYAALQIGQSALNAGLSLWLVLGFGMAWEGRLIGNAAAVIVFSLLACWGLWSAGWIKFPASKEYSGDALKFGVPLIPHTAGGVILAVADRFIITNTIGIEAAGIYTVAFQLAMPLGLLADSFCKAYGPWLYERLHEGSLESRLRIVGVTYLAFISFIGLYIGAWLVLWLAFDLLVPASYADARILIGWLLLGHVFKAMYFTVAGFFFFNSKTFQLSKITITVGSLQVLAIWYSTQFIGIEGAAMSFTFASALLFLAAWKVGATYVGLPWLSFREAANSLRSTLQRN